MHLLGVLAHQGKKPDIAVQLISSVIKKQPDVAVFHYNLAEALTSLGQNEEALAEYQRAVELDPDYFEAQNNLANALNEKGRHAEAEAAARQAVELAPEDATPLNNLANALRGQRRLEEAIDTYQRAIRLRPDFAEAMDNLASTLCAAGQTDRGIEQFREAIRLKPTLVNAHNNLGATLMRLGRCDEAIQCFKTAIDLKPDHAEANNNMGAALQRLGQIEDSVEFFRKAAKLKPTFAEAHGNLAGSLHELGRKDEALEAVDAVLALRPKSAKDHFLRAMILRELLRPDEGIEALREALRLDPDNASVMPPLGYALLERGDMDEAMAMLLRSIELRPNPQTHSNVLMTMNYHPGFSPADLLKSHQSWAEVHEKPQMEKWRVHENDRDPNRRLRVGYVSPDFRGHVVGFFVGPILQHHDHEQFEVFAYAHLITADWDTWRMRAGIDQWRETEGHTPDEIAEQIREDKIDILIDLAGHTGNNALETFARKAAPVQINMIGFPSTTGLSSMDYRVTDELCDPTGVSDAYNSEALIRIPGLFWSFMPPTGTGDVGPLPALKNGFVTFTSVNNLTKVTPNVQRMWARVLREVPNSRLIIQTHAMSSEHAQEAVKGRFAELGITEDRLDFRKPKPLGEYLNLLNESDMTLDPFPFNGGTTTCHSLWMGAPVITLAGDRHASRMGLSMLTAIGLPELVAHTPDEYVQIAVGLAKDLPRLAAIRAGMRERLKASPLMDGAGYTKKLEAAYREVWHKWCASGK
jgi:predicted O-linked N-acetylglucosamine transferase (SPINDLY family)